MNKTGAKKMRNKKQRLLPKNQKKSKRKRRTWDWYLVTGSVVVFVIISAMALFSQVAPGPSHIYSRDLTITGKITEGITTPNFHVKQGHIIRIEITDLNLITGHSLHIAIQGGGMDWTRLTDVDGVFRASVPTDSQYNVRLSVNSVTLNGRITCNLQVRVIA